MASRRNRKKKEQTEASEDDGKPAKEEYAVAKYMRQKLPVKKTMLLGHKVDYFIAARAIDCLLDSPWATNTGKREAIFTTRESVLKFMDKMLQHKFFHRAKKIVVVKDPKKKKKEEETPVESSKEQKDKKKDSKAKDDKKKDSKAKDDKKKDSKAKEDVATESNKAKEPKEKKKESKLQEEDTAADSSKDKTKESKGKEEEEKKEGDKEEKKKEKRKIKLDMHMEQLFIDSNEPYVWIYDPIPMRTWIIGMLMVVGAVLVCLFPLWPQTIRHYIYYLSVAAAFFLVFIIGLAIIRLVVFVLIWAVTFGKHHLWLLPNLTEDVGFFESFWPLYMYEYKGVKKEKKEPKKEEEEEEEEKTKEEEDTSISKDTQEKEGDKSDSSSEDKKNPEDQEDSEESESDKEKTENGDNGFEILDPEEENLEGEIPRHSNT